MLLIIIPLSGWDKETALVGKPGLISWSLLLRNATGILRNVSSAGSEARATIRSIEGLIDACFWIVRAAVASDADEDINNKVRDVSSVSYTYIKIVYDDKLF